MSHSSTITGELLVALKTKMKLIIGPTIVPPRYVLNNIKKYGVTLLCINPTLLSMYSDELNRREYNISSLKTIYVSGAILTNQVYEKARIAFKDIAIYNVYGLSELGPRVTAQRAGYCKNNSVGIPIKNVKIVIVNEQGSIVTSGEYGIIHVKTPSISNGYIVGYQKHNSLYKNWYNTGDIGYIDDYGELHIVSRLDDVIIIDSHKIYPSEIESIILSKTQVKECAVVKLRFNCKEVIGCLYVNDFDCSENIIRDLSNLLMSHEIPKFFLKCNSIPKTINGKISKNEIEKYLEMLKYDF
jgi:acyl-coenzyme A synthetase/AMP-(fatty) acid ligase